MQRSNIPVMILAGGLGTRLREETEFRPKPMVPIGGKPILWHIMKMYAQYGFYRFIICLGYKGDMIREYFLNYHYRNADITVNTRTGMVTEHQLNEDSWEVTLVETGETAFTGARVARASKYVDTDTFMLTYGDGIADINIEQLLAFHRSHGKLATLTGVKNPFRFGNLVIEHDAVKAFKEEEQTIDSYVNGGFFVLNKQFLSYVSQDDGCILERAPLERAAQSDQLMVYRHNGFWQCMDTMRDHEKLEELWVQGAPWKLWDAPQVVSSESVDIAPLKKSISISGLAQ